MNSYFHVSEVPSLAYDRAIASIVSGELDRSQGRTVKIDGNIFFSPNCQRTPTLPPSDFDPMSRRNSFKHDVREFHEPHWWHPATAYLAFLPLELRFYGIPFQSLFNIPKRFDKIDSGFMLDPQIVLQWNVVEKDLKFAVERLLSHHHAPKLKWIMLTALGCQGWYNNVTILRDDVINARGWFAVLVAGLSYAIAVSVSIYNDPLDNSSVPTWFHVLFNQQMEQLWLSGIQASSAATFNASVDRAGVLLNILEPERGQFSVDWLCRFHVPVWYPWGAREARAAISDNKIARLAPLPHQLQEVNTFLTKTPKTHDSFSGPKPWEAFFAERALRNERIAERENPKQRQSREDRQKKPPTKKCKVYVWRRDNDGGYTRESIFQSENEEELDFYGKNQKVYDAFSNCWDVCEDFGAAAPEEFDANDDEPDEFYPSAPSNPLSMDSPSHSRSISGSSHSAPESSQPQQALSPINSSPRPHQEVVPIPRIAQSGYSYEQYETSQLLYDFLGFVHPLPLPPTLLSPLDDRDKNLIKAISGLHRDDTAFFDSPVASFAAEFMNKINTQTTPKNSSWDLANGNRIALATSQNFKSMYIQRYSDTIVTKEGPKRVQMPIFLFNFEQATSVPWIIAVPNATNALFVCRLGPSLTDYEIAHELLNRGIEFRTLLRLPRTAPSPPIPIIVPVRLPGYVFTFNDYHGYVQQRCALLADPRVARAALLRGGIVWRLAIATLSFDDVLHGPTVAATLYRRGFTIQTSDGSLDLCDDGLSQRDYDVICGLHHCYTGKYINGFFFSGNNFITGYGSDCASKSWWPTDTTWKTYASHAHWTEKSENIYLKRLKEFENDKPPQPLDSQAWRELIRPYAFIRRANTYVLESSLKFLENLPEMSF